ncbi:MOSC domain-containing protein [Streptomyces sp. HPF1205]|uniref:MOSC domain-containing protein n=1 Tax=Streptomyces sp. HPF1205 TaxID=2873262 RepID=UPI001CEC1793|nr:MOSC N-terminal beta barrel domain-containing protein [Streptomyces sp. HPF1205]
MARVVELSYYPVKGCAGVRVDEAEVTSAGIAHDRSFMVTTAEGVFRSQRRTPRLALIRPATSADGSRLTLRGPGLDPLAVEVDTSGARRDVTLFAAPFKGIDQGDEAAGWLSEFLGAPSRLVRVPPEHDRVTDGRTPGTSGYADSCAVHLVSRVALGLLNARMAERGAPALPVDRFRPNIVVDGWDEPHAEDRIRRVRIGGVELGYAKLAIRCVVTTVDQAEGAKTGPEPLRTLAGYRRAAGGGVAFGVKFAVLGTGKLSVGDEVGVASWGESEL